MKTWITITILFVVIGGLTLSGIILICSNIDKPNNKGSQSKDKEVKPEESIGKIEQTGLIQPPKIIRTIIVVLNPGDKITIPEIRPGRTIMVVNGSQQTLTGEWGEWKHYSFQPGQKVYNFSNYKPGNKFIITNPSNQIVQNCTAYVMEGI